MANIISADAQIMVDSYPCYKKEDNEVFQCFWITAEKDGHSYYVDETNTTTLPENSDLATVKSHLKTLFEATVDKGINTDAIDSNIVDTELT